MRTCPYKGKVMYREEDHAKEARKTIKYRTGFEKLRVYRCPYCKKYHLTSKDEL